MTSMLALALFLTSGSTAAAEDPLKPFALDLYAQVRATPGNVAVSPFSVASALVPLAEGARGATRSEIERALRLDKPWPESKGAVLATLGAAGARSEGGVEVLSANGLWVDRRIRLLPAYVEELKTRLDTRAAPADFAEHPEAVASDINAFVSSATREMIPKLVDRLDRRLRLFLVNAVYFKGLWASQFRAEATRPLPFRSPGRAAKTVPFMRQTESFRYAEDGRLQALEMPYEGGAASMVVLLPRSDDGLASLEATLDETALDEILAGMRKRQVDVLIPRFRIESSLGREFMAALQALGLKTAMTDAADFSGMTGGRDLFVSEGIHKVVVDVDEKGTEAAAATGIGMQPTSLPPPPPVFRADHPFLFLIRDVPTGAILFIGRIVEP